MVARKSQESEIMVIADVPTFEQFLAERHIGNKAEIVPLLRECWDQSARFSFRHALASRQGIKDFIKTGATTFDVGW